MASVLIKNLPDELHRRLKQRAERHHRSLNKEVIALIEATLGRQPAQDPPKPATPRNPLTPDRLEETRRKRITRILALHGKYKAAVSSSEEFAARKEDEITLER
jgi:plasmid stability protein